MTEHSKKTEILDSIQESQKLYENISEQIIKLSEKTNYNKEIKNFASFIVSITNDLVKKGYVEFLLGLDNLLMRSLSPRIGIHRFTQFDLDTNSDDYFEYFKKIDEEHEKVKALNSITDIKQHTKNLQNLLNEDPPGMDQKTRSKTVENYQLEKYFMEILDAIAQHYESLSLVTLYCLILVKTYLGISTEDDIKKLRNSKKDTVSNLYFDTEGIKKLLEGVDFEENFRKEILAWYETIYGKESIRELRNLKTHNYTEKGMKYKNGLLYVTYQNGTKKTYTYEEIKNLKAKMQLSVFICFYLVANSFHYMLHELLIHENDENNK